MRRHTRISESEWKVMEVIWRDGAVTAQEVIHALDPSADWKPQTVKTMLSRLVKKGALKYEVMGNRFIYEASCSREEAAEKETGSFLKRVCKGSLVPLLSHSLETRKTLDEEEVEALRRLLDAQEEN